MKQAYRDIKYLKKKTLAQIATANDIVEEYQAQGLSVTLRQVYYQFVARDLIPNSDRSYKSLGNALMQGRYAGLLSWTAIEDRTRFLRRLDTWDTPHDIVTGAADQYRTDKWANQPVRIEVWVEKDALVGVIEAACNPLEVPYFSCRGYVSSSEIWQAHRRMLRYAEDDGQPTIILHLGDHDPSGVQMTEDMQGRLHEFWHMDGWDIGMHMAPEVRRIALNMDQVRAYNPPPNPAKLKDSRARQYIELYGSDSWELDALNPTTMRDLIVDEVHGERDADQWQADVDAQMAQREDIRGTLELLDHPNELEHLRQIVKDLDAQWPEGKTAEDRYAITRRLQPAFNRAVS